MTITPTAVTPAVLPATDGAAPGSTPGATAVPGDFLALVQQALAAALGGTPATPATTGGAPAPGDAQSRTKDGATPEQDGTGTAATAADAALAAATNGLVAVVAPVLPIPAAGAPVAAGPAAGAVTAASGAASGAATAAVAPAGPQPAPVAGTHAGAEAKAQTTGVISDADPAAVTTTTTGAAHAGRADSGQSSDAGTGQQAPAPAPPAPAPLAGVTTPSPAAAPTAPVATGAPAPAPAAAPVTGQVFPEVTSLVSRGDGTHRITLTLKPEALGEVRVVMTMRDGAVHVRLAAGHEAQQALLAGSSELTRLLEHAGATDTRIVVRDLAGTTAPTTGASNDRGADLGQAPGSGLGAGDNRSQDQHAGTRAEHHATDGTHVTTTAGTTSPRPDQPATRTRTAGVDVTM